MNAQEALNRNLDNAMALAEMIQRYAENEKDNPRPNWADVGSASHLVEQLSNALLDTMGLDDENDFQAEVKRQYGYTLV